MGGDSVIGSPAALHNLQSGLLMSHRVHSMPAVASQRATTAVATASVVCLGETMATLIPPRGVALADANNLQCGIGGAESNVAAGLAPVAPTHWVSRVGADGFGQRILRELTACGVGVEAVEIDPERPTGLYVKTPLLGRGRSRGQFGDLLPQSIGRRRDGTGLPRQPGRRRGTRRRVADPRIRDHRRAV